MAKRYVDVYRDADSETSDDSIGIRDNGDATAIYGHELNRWRRSAKFYSWRDGDEAEALKSMCGELIGRIEYDDGEPEVCAPSS